MPKAKVKKVASVEDLLRDLLIVQLGLAGVSQPKIRTIVGGDMHYVSRIVRHLKIKGKKHEK